MLSFSETLDEYYTDDDWKKVDPMSRAIYYDPEKKPLKFLHHNYVFGLVRFTVNTYVTLGLSYLFGADDQSGLLTPTIDIEPFQALGS